MEHFATSSPLSLEKLDLYEVDSITSSKSLEVIPPSGSNRQYRIVIGDGSGSLQCISLKKGGVIDINFKAKIPEGKIESITLGESTSGEKRIFVSAGTAVRGLTRRGKEFFRFSTNIIEPLKSMVFTSSHLHGIGDTVYNAYNMEGQDVMSVSIPSGIGAMCGIVLPETHVHPSLRPPYSAIIGCNDGFLRLLSTPQSSSDVHESGIAFPIPPSTETNKQFLCSLRTPGPITSLTQWHPTPVLLLNTERLNSQKRISEIQDRIHRDRQILQGRLTGLGLASGSGQSSGPDAAQDEPDASTGAPAPQGTERKQPQYRVDTLAPPAAPDSAHASWIHSPSRPGAGEMNVTEDGYVVITYFVYGTSLGHIGLVALQEKEEYVAPPSRSYKTPTPAPVPPSVAGLPRYRLHQVWCIRSAHSQPPPKPFSSDTTSDFGGGTQPLHATAAASSAAVSSIATFDLSDVRSSPTSVVTAPNAPLDSLRGEILVGRQDGSVEVYSVEHAAFEAFQTEMLGAQPVDAAQTLAKMHTPGEGPQSARTGTGPGGTKSGEGSAATSARSTYSTGGASIKSIGSDRGGAMDVGSERKPLPPPKLLFRGNLGSAVRAVAGAKLQHPDRPELLVLTMDGRITSYTPKLALLEFPDNEEEAMLTDERLREANALLSSIQEMQTLISEKKETLVKLQEANGIDSDRSGASARGAAAIDLDATGGGKDAPDRLYPLEVSWTLEPDMAYASYLDQQTALAHRRSMSTSVPGAEHGGLTTIPSDPLVPPFPGPNAFIETNVPLFLEGVACLSIETPIDMDHVLLSSELPLDLPDIPDYHALAQKGFFAQEGASGGAPVDPENIPAEIQERMDRHRLYKTNMLKERGIDITYDATRITHEDTMVSTIAPPEIYTKDTEYAPPAPRALSVVVFSGSSQKRRLHVRFLPVEGFHGDLQIVTIPASADKPWTLTHSLTLCSLSLHQRVLDIPLSVLREELQKNWTLFLQNRGRDADTHSSVGIPLTTTAPGTVTATSTSRSRTDAATRVGRPTSSQGTTPFSSSLRSIASHHTDTDTSVLQSDGTVAPATASSSTTASVPTATSRASGESLPSSESTGAAAEISAFSGANALERVRANVMDVLRAVSVIRPLVPAPGTSGASDTGPDSSLYAGRFSDLLLAQQHFSALYELPVGSLPNDYPFSTLSTRGNFTAAQVHDWLRECLPNHPVQVPTHEDGTPYGATEGSAVQFVYMHSTLGTVLFVEYWNNHLVVQSDNPTSLMILWTHVIEGASLAKCELQVQRDVSPFAGTYFLHVIHERLARVILQMAKTSLVSAVRDVVTSVESLSERLMHIRNRFSELLERCGRMKRIPSVFRTGNEGLTQALHDVQKEYPWVDETLLELFLFGDIYESESMLFRDTHTRLCGYIADAFVDFHKLLSGKNVSDKIPELLQFFDEKYLYRVPGDNTKSEMLRAIEYFNNPTSSIGPSG